MPKVPSLTFNSSYHIVSHIPDFYELVFVDSHAFWLSPLAAIHSAPPFL